MTKYKTLEEIMLEDEIENLMFRFRNYIPKQDSYNIVDGESFTRLCKAIYIYGKEQGRKEMKPDGWLAIDEKGNPLCKVYQLADGDMTYENSNHGYVGIKILRGHEDDN